MIPTGSQSSGLHAALPLGPLQQADRYSPEQAQVRPGVTAPRPGLVFAEGHVENPMQSVLDAPMPADESADLSRRSQSLGGMSEYVTSRFSASANSRATPSMSCDRGPVSS